MNTNGPFSTLNSDQRNFLSDSAQENLDFIVIGGYAMRCHGHERSTTDLDLLVNHDSTNATRLSSVLYRWNYFDPDLAEKLPKKTNARILVHSAYVDIHTNLEGFEFNDVGNRASEVNFDDYIIRVASRKDLLVMKKTSEREEDRADINFLKNR